jgi:hypothetical protein
LAVIVSAGALLFLVFQDCSTASFLGGLAFGGHCFGGRFAVSCFAEL